LCGGDEDKKGNGNDLYLWKAIKNVKKMSHQCNNQTLAPSFLLRGHEKRKSSFEVQCCDYFPMTN
jgi:hypothetical protein